jgi:undecaprenyl-diphosphatase
VKFFLNGNMFTTNEWIILGVGVVTAFVVSVLAIKFLVRYVQTNDFAPFGWYRIVVGILVLAYFWAIAA